MVLLFLNGNGTLGFDIAAEDVVTARGCTPVAEGGVSSSSPSSGDDVALLFEGRCSGVLGAGRFEDMIKDSR